MTKFLKYLNDENSVASGSAEQLSFVPMKNKKKFKKLNPKTNRMKTSRKTLYYETKIQPEERSLKNLPRYSDGKSKVRFQDWLEIEKEDNGCYGKSCNGKYYGWSHRAISSFKAGDEIKNSDNLAYDPKRKLPYKIKDEKDAKDHAIRFAKNVA